VDTPDAVLVTTRARAQELKRVVTALRERGDESLT
jgi:mannose-1-phosphate guanylyltransferase